MFSNMAESFSNNLVVEDRYRMILDGEKKRTDIAVSPLFHH